MQKKEEDPAAPKQAAALEAENRELRLRVAQLEERETFLLHACVEALSFFKGEQRGDAAVDAESA